MPLDITRAWSHDEPLVSVPCATYRHIEFIERALLGFLGQVTDSPFEVLVRNEASTDGTTELPRAFKDRYQDIIRPVLETKNWYFEVVPERVLRPLVRGWFIALCGARLRDRLGVPLALGRGPVRRPGARCRGCSHCAIS